MKSADDFLFEIEIGNLSMELDNCFYVFLICLLIARRTENHVPSFRAN